MNSSISDAAALASRFINHTNCHIFLTGKAGTGKTTFLRHIVRYTHKKAVIAAPTGIAAINAGGVTLHSLFQLPFGCFVPVNQTQAQPSLRFSDPFSLIRNQQMNENKRKLLREMELLIIDEVSMLRADLLDAIDTVLRHVRRNASTPFGGVQMLFIGDLLQLPPVVKEDEWNLMRNYYNSAFFFDAQVLKQEKPLYVELDKIYRQKDDEFVELLNHLRNNTVTPADIALLEKYYQPGFRPSPSENYITLTTHNHKADSINREMLQELKTDSFIYDAEIQDEFSEYAYPVDQRMQLKEGAQVMFVKNDPTGAQRFFNGKIGTVKTLNKGRIEVQFNDTGNTISVEKYEWTNTKYVLNETTSEIEEKTAGTFTQYPLKLAWAITVHKSQGLTFEKAVVDIGQAFAPGQVYVALSRLTSLKGLILLSPVNKNALLVDGQVKQFAQTREAQEDLEIRVEKESRGFLEAYLLQRFDLSGLLKVLRDHIASYNNQKDEKRSAKQKYSQRMAQILVKLESLKPDADKFRMRISQIIGMKEEGYMYLLKDRVEAARNYFTPLLWEQSAAVIALMAEAKNEKKIKTYLKELLTAETAIYNQVTQMDKAQAMTTTMAEKREFTRHEITATSREQERLQQLEKILVKKEEQVSDEETFTDEEQPDETVVKKTPGRSKYVKKEKKKKAEPKPEKVDTKKLSLQLYREGKTIDEIAKERAFARSTIETHLSFFISKGELSITDFITEKQFSKISVELKKNGNFDLGILKGTFGDEFTYGELRMAMAGYLAKEDEE